MILKIILTVLIIILPINQKASADQLVVLPIGLFSQGSFNEWDTKAFVGETKYSQVFLEGNTVLKAESDSAASGLIKKVKVDLNATPFLNWQWRIENRLTGTYDEKEKSGDDYAARLYVIVSGGLAVWNTRALNYVWSKHSQKGDLWPNAFVKDNSMMFALRSSEAPVSEWQTEKRNIKADFKRIYGKDIQYIHAVSVMSDTDNTESSVTAYYGDIFFSSK